MKRESLKAEKRIIAGKQVKKLRRKGILPANIFGKNFASTQVQLPLKEFVEVFSKVHETGLIDLEVGSETHPVLIKNVQVHPLEYTPIHADFYRVNLKEKVKTAIPIVSIGEPKAVTDKIGVLLQTLNEIEVEALPTDLPEHFEVNVEGLAQVDDNITLEDLKIPTGVTVLTEGTPTIFRIDDLVSEAAEELAAEEEAAAEAAADEGADATAEKAEGEEGKEESGESGSTEEAKADAEKSSE